MVVMVRRHSRVVPTRESVLRYASLLKRDHPTAIIHIFRIGGHWKATSKTLEQTQEKYIYPVREWEAV